MKVKYYIKCGEMYVLLNSYNGGRSYILRDNLKEYSHEKCDDAGDYLLVYDTLEDARRAADTQFRYGIAGEDFPDGLAIEKVTSRFFGLWKKREILSII